MRPSAASPEEVVAEIASRQHGVVTLAQLLEAGFSRDAVKRRTAKRLLFRVHMGVYRVGHRAPSAEARYMAAVLACGEDAVLSGMAAAWHYGIVKGRPPMPVVSAEGRRTVRGVITRRVRRLDRRDVTRWRGVPVTTIPRTLVDLAAELELQELARVCHEAQVRYRVRPPAVDAVLERRPRPPGAPKLREIFHGQAAVTLSELEREFLRVLKANGLPPPETNRRVDGRYVDCRWPGPTPEREARPRGDEFRRYTYADVFEDLTLMLAELRALASGRTSLSPAATAR